MKDYLSLVIDLSYVCGNGFAYPPVFLQPPDSFTEHPCNIRSDFLYEHLDCTSSHSNALAIEAKQEAGRRTLQVFHASLRRPALREDPQQSRKTVGSDACTLKCFITQLCREVLEQCFMLS